MDFLDQPLLNTPSLTLSLLKVAAKREWATLEDGLAHLKGVFAQAHESPAVAVTEIVSHLQEVRRHLVAAGLLSMADDGRFTITERGRQVPAEHPMGVDDSVLTQFGEFREFIRRSSPHRVPENPELVTQEEGHGAFLDGQSAVRQSVRVRHQQAPGLGEWLVRGPRRAVRSALRASAPGAR